MESNKSQTENLPSFSQYGNKMNDDNAKRKTGNINSNIRQNDTSIYDNSSSPNQIENPLTQLSQPSKRAKMMLQAISGGDKSLKSEMKSTMMNRFNINIPSTTQVPVRKSSKEMLFASLGGLQVGNSSSVVSNGIRGGKDMGGIGGVMSGIGKQKKKLFYCVVCKDSIPLPYAARCGHVCCRSCWDRWLGLGHNTCPLCKKITSKEEITAIEFK